MTCPRPETLCVEWTELPKWAKVFPLNLEYSAKSPPQPAGPAGPHP